MTVDAGRRIALVATLAVMIVGAGQWLLVSADVPQVPANTWAPAGDLGAVPEGSAAAVLADGRMVIAGGRYSDGTLVSQIGIFNPASQSWDDGGQLTLARTGHTATALEDGRVLIAGGRTEMGPSFDIEIYNPNTRQSVHAGDLLVARVNHAAATLGNGSVLIVGGSNGSGVLDDIELFDPEAGQTQSLAARMAVAREKLTATRLLDGHVLIAGGRNESGDLAIAEIFVSGSHSIFETGALKTARSGHAAVLLPNNNQVLIAGGTVNGAPVASAELYADWRDGFRVVANPMAQARTGAVAGFLPQHDLAFVGGGGSTSGEYFGYATVKTDKDDYAPGEPVVISGSGFQPGETVAIKISEDADTHNDFIYEAVVDAQGRFTNSEFAPIENETFHHIGMRFYLVASGAASQALNTFTDAPKVTGVYMGGQTPSPVTQGNSATYGVSVTSDTNSSAVTSVSLSVVAGTSALPPGVTVAPGSLAIGRPSDASVSKCIAGRGVPNGVTCYDSFDVSIATTTSTPPGTYGLKLRANAQGNDSAEGSFTLVVVGAIRPTSTSVTCVANPIVVNASTTCTATVSDTGTGTATAPAGTVAFASNSSGTFDFTSCTLGNDAKCSVVYTPSARGTGSHAITGSYSATSSHSNSSNSSSPFNLTVNKADQTTFNLTTPPSLVYGVAGTASATGGSGDGAVTFSAGSSTGCSVNPTSGEITVTNASGNCAISAQKAADDNYLVATAGPNTVTLQKADADVTVTGFSGIYDAAAHGATGTAKGVGGVDLSARLDLGASFTNVPGGTANWTFTGGSNYLDESGSVQIVINKAHAVVSVAGYSGTYDAAPHGASGTAVGVGGVNLSAQLNLGATFTDAPGGTANWTFTGGTNYFDKSGSVQIVINKADATVSVTGFSGTYDAQAHGATGTATGVGGVDLSAGLNLGPTFTDVPGGTANWTFTGGTNYNDKSGSVEIVIDKADATVSVNGYSGTYDGNAHGATGSATGIGGVALPGLNLGESFTDAPGGTANWTFSGGTNYRDQSGSVEITISKADATVNVSGYTGTYDAQPHGATGSATGIGGVALPGLNLGESFTDAPGGTANWSFTGGTNYNDESGSVEIVINKADAAVSVNGYTGTYDGNAHGATGSATGVGGVDLGAQLNLGDSFTDAPGGMANWTFNGGTNYNDKSGSVEIVINKADANVSVNGYTGTYDGNAHGATGSATGVGGVDLSAQLNFGESFTDVPGGTANWTFTGGTNYNDAYGSVDIVINQADATIVVTPYDVIYDTTPHTATGSATGVKGENLSGLLDLSGTTHTNAGTYTDSWTFAGNGNYKAANGTVTDRIQKATPVITWNAPAAITYPTALSGTQLNATANVPGGFVYSPASGTPLNAGSHTLHVDFTPADTGNYNNASKDVSITVYKGSQTITFGALANKTFGDPPVPVSATGGASGNPVTFSTLDSAMCTASPNGLNAANIAIHAVGVCTVRASQAGSDNYNPAPDVERSFSIAAWTAQGFHQPVGIPNSVFAPATTSLLGAPPSSVWNSARGGSTIPLKFNLFAAGVERTSTADIIGFATRMLPGCSGGAYDDPVDIETAGATVLRYDGVAGSGGQFIQNWKTPAVKGEQCYRVELTFRDQSVLYTFVKLKK